MAETKVVRLNSGEYLICKLSENQDGTVTLFEALAFQVVPSGEPNKPGLMFYVAFPFAEDPKSVTLPKEVVHYSMTPNAQIESVFREKTSGLITPSGTGKILT
jgi:hypothetical protein